MVVFRIVPVDGKVSMGFAVSCGTLDTSSPRHSLLPVLQKLSQTINSLTLNRNLVRECGKTNLYSRHKEVFVLSVHFLPNRSCFFSVRNTAVKTKSIQCDKIINLIWV